jgi:hypothetical protein
MWMGQFGFRRRVKAALIYLADAGPTRPQPI